MEPASRVDNCLLAALPDADLTRLAPDLEPVELPAGASLYEVGQRKGMLYFLASGIASLQRVTSEGASTEIAVVGTEGVVGVSMFMGGRSAPWRAVAQSAVRALGLRATIVEHEFRRGGPLHDALLRYTQTLILQISQTALCNRHHSIEQQICRALLLRFDRIPASELQMTQEVLAGMLGVRRAGVTEAARRLQQAGIIRYVRGRIDLLDRTGLEQRACECYGVVRRTTEALLEDLAAHRSIAWPSAQA